MSSTWASITKSAAPAAAPEPVSRPLESRQTQAVLDTNSLLAGSGTALQALAVDRYLTTQEVVDEIKDRQSRQYLAALPFPLEVKECSEESLRAGGWVGGCGCHRCLCCRLPCRSACRASGAARWVAAAACAAAASSARAHACDTSKRRWACTPPGPLPACTQARKHSHTRAVTRFARETGDIHALSAADLRVLALCHTLEVASNGSSQLREHPMQVGEVGHECALPVCYKASTVLAALRWHSCLLPQPQAEGARARPPSWLCSHNMQLWLSCPHAQAALRSRHRTKGRAMPGWGHVPNPEDWKVVDDAAQDAPTGA